MSNTRISIWKLAGHNMVPTSFQAARLTSICRVLILAIDEAHFAFAFGGSSQQMAKGRCEPESETLFNWKLATALSQKRLHVSVHSDVITRC